MVHFLSDKIELGDSDLKIMLKKHHEKRKHQPVRLGEGVAMSGSQFTVPVLSTLRKIADSHCLIYVPGHSWGTGTAGEASEV